MTWRRNCRREYRLWPSAQRSGRFLAGPQAYARAGRVREDAMPGEPTLLRTLITARHWQRYETFAVQFKRAAKKLADEEGKEELAKMSVSARQLERRYGGKLRTLPHPDACRILEHIFGYPVRQLLAPGDPPSQETSLVLGRDDPRPAPARTLAQGVILGGVRVRRVRRAVLDPRHERRAARPGRCGSGGSTCCRPGSRHAFPDPVTGFQTRLRLSPLRPCLRLRALILLPGLGAGLRRRACRGRRSPARRRGGCLIFR